MTTIPHEEHVSAAIERFAALPDEVEACAALQRAQNREIEELRASNERLEHELGAVPDQVAARLTGAIERIGSAHAKRDVVSMVTRQLTPIIDVARSIEESVLSRRELEEIIGEVRQRVLTLLRLLGVEVLEAEPGDPFDPTTMCPRQRSVTTDESCHRTVAAVLHPGFRFEGALIRAQDVAVYDAHYEAEGTR